jgi:hypothetical protein
MFGDGEQLPPRRAGRAGFAGGPRFRFSVHLTINFASAGTGFLSG